MEFEAIFKKGKYCIGDPCYVFGKGYSDIMHEIHNSLEGEFVIGRKKAFSSGTHSGDGVYLDKEGREYWVDSGLLGIFPVGSSIRESPSEGVHVIKFAEDFTVKYKNGNFKFADIEIITDGSDEEEDEY